MCSGWKTATVDRATTRDRKEMREGEEEGRQVGWLAGWRTQRERERDVEWGRESQESPIPITPITCNERMGLHTQGYKTTGNQF